MDPKHTIYIGVDISSTGSHFYFAALDSKLSLTILEKGQMGDVWEYALHHNSVLIACNFPSHLNQGMMNTDDIREQFGLSPRSLRWSNLRVGEYLLLQKGIHCPRTPSLIDECPTWLQNGLIFYQVLHNKGFDHFSAGNSPLSWVEVNTEASFQFLLGHPLHAQKSLEGRLQRQLLLFESGLNIHDPIECFEEVTRHKLLHGQFPFETIYSFHEIQALSAAYTAWLILNRPQHIMKYGFLEEGQIYLPSPVFSS